MKQYQIRSLISATGHISDQYKDGKIRWTMDTRPRWKDPFLIAKGASTSFSIHSIERLSDGAIFTVGDEVGLTELMPSGNIHKLEENKITSISLDNVYMSNVSVHLYGDSVGWCMSKLRCPVGGLTIEDRINKFITQLKEICNEVNS